MQWFAVSMVLIVLSIVHIDALKYRSVRQAVSQCPNVNFCDYVRCEHGQCAENKTIADCFSCICSPGYTGSLCETPLTTGSGCNPPCQNQGQCQQTALNIFACVCPPEYTGTQCETSVLAIHPCVTRPTTVCQNGGTCTINGADYLCNCPMGWTGTNCQTEDTITTCNSNPCGAHGTCLQAILPTNTLAIFCRCEAQWTGKYCDSNLAGNCSTGFCQNGGSCLMNGNTPYCMCPSTHTGQQCETSLIPLTTVTTTTMTSTTAGLFTTTTTSTTGTTSGRCTSTSCANGGSCFNTGNSFICLCPAQYTGLTCNLQQSVTTAVPTTASSINACASSPCQNGGSCYKYGSSFVCVCTGQFTGATCNVIKTTTSPTLTTPSTTITCANQPCQNGGTCYNAGSSYFCYCGTSSTYTGKNCETSLVAADPTCSLNCSPGYCVRVDGIDNTYACMCNGVFTPTSCSSN